jgi:hypothetical protein
VEQRLHLRRTRFERVTHTLKKKKEQGVLNQFFIQDVNKMDERRNPRLGDPADFRRRPPDRHSSFSPLSWTAASTSPGRLAGSPFLGIAMRQDIARNCRPATN